VGEGRARRFVPTEATMVGFLGADARFTGDIVNISSTGLLVRCSADLPLGSMGRIGFEVGAETVRMLAVVRRRVPDVGLAFQFVRMSSRDRALLQRVLWLFSTRQSSSANSPQK